VLHPPLAKLTLIHMFWKRGNPSHEYAMESPKRKQLSVELCEERKTASPAAFSVKLSISRAF
jgi:hypothetical protein